MVHENSLRTIGGNADEEFLVRRGDGGHGRNGRAVALPMAILGRGLGLAYKRLDTNVEIAQRGKSGLH